MIGLTFRIFFEVAAPHLFDALNCNPDAFLTACAIPALFEGEERIEIDEPGCPELVASIQSVMRTHLYWYRGRYAGRTIPRIEAPLQSRAPQRPNRSGILLSGGLDSLSTLRANALALPLGHPSRFADGIYVQGLEDFVDAASDTVLKSLSLVAKDAGLTLIPVRTNLRCLNEDWNFWMDQFEGAVFAATAHAFSNRLSSMTISSSSPLSTLLPHASHPITDALYSSADMRFEHGDVSLSRLDKVALLKGWQVGLDNLRVCFQPRDCQPMNCGRCQKCVVTILELLVHGVLGQSASFAVSNAEPSLIRCLERLTHSYEDCEELLDPLRAMGRSDLANALWLRMRRHDLRRHLKSLDENLAAGQVAMARSWLRRRVH